jgi:hypothetical protein
MAASWRRRHALTPWVPSQALFPQPGGFEGLLTVGEDPEPGEPPALDRPDEREQLIQLHTARLGRAPAALEALAQERRQ